MKADPYSIKRKERPTKEFVLADGAFEAVLLLRRFGVVGVTAYQERADEMYRKYVTGSGPRDEHGNVDQESKSFVPPLPLPLVDGEPVLLTKTTCQACAAVELAQVQEEGYTFEELAMTCVSDKIAQVMVEAWSWTIPEEEKDAPFETSKEPSALTVLDGTESTPPSSSGTPNSSGASTNGSGASAPATDTTETCPEPILNDPALTG